MKLIIVSLLSLMKQDIPQYEMIDEKRSIQV